MYTIFSLLRFFTQIKQTCISTSRHNKCAVGKQTLWILLRTLCLDGGADVLVSLCLQVKWSRGLQMARGPQHKDGGKNRVQNTKLKTNLIATVWCRSGLQVFFPNIRNVARSWPRWERCITSVMLGFNYRGFGRWYIILRNTELTGPVKWRHVHVTIFAVEKQ
jgi:hypothetical protein